MAAPVRSTSVTRKVDAQEPSEIVSGSIRDAARYLGCSPGTLANWISAKKFTKADGLRKVGGLTRIHMPTLQKRFADGSLMMGKG